VEAKSRQVTEEAYTLVAKAVKQTGKKTIFLL
jgi:hypothetical protein